MAVLVPLTGAARIPTLKGVSRPDGRSGRDRKVAGEESPGSMDVRCRITSGEAVPAQAGTGLRDSATEKRPPRLRCVLGRGKGETVR